MDTLHSHDLRQERDPEAPESEEGRRIGRLGRWAMMATGASIGVAAAASQMFAQAATGITSKSHTSSRWGEQGRLLDLTHTFSTSFPVGSSTSPERRSEFTIDTDGLYAQRWSFWEHTATHVDAPGHFIKGGRLVPDLRLEELMFIPAVVIDISDRAAHDADTALTVNDITAYEKRQGSIKKGLSC